MNKKQAVSFSVFLLATPIATYAGWGDAFDAISRGAAELDPTSRNSSAGRAVRGAVSAVTVDFKVCNETGNPVHFSVNGNRKFLGNNHCSSFTDWPAGTDIAFDWSYSSGYQRQSYDVTHGRNYVFEKVSGGIELYHR